jgi:hypothetical protein
MGMPAMLAILKDIEHWGLPIPLRFVTRVALLPLWWHQIIEFMKHSGVRLTRYYDLCVMIKTTKYCNKEQRRVSNC